MNDRRQGVEAGHLGCAEVGGQRVGEVHLDAVAGVDPQHQRLDRHPRFETVGFAVRVVGQVVVPHVQQRGRVDQRTFTVDAAEGRRERGRPRVVDETLRSEHVDGAHRGEIERGRRHGDAINDYRTDAVEVGLVGDPIAVLAHVVVGQFVQVVALTGVRAEDAPHTGPHAFQLGADRVDVVHLVRRAGAGVGHDRHVEVEVLVDPEELGVPPAGVRAVGLLSPLEARDGEVVLLLVGPDLDADPHLVAHVHA